MPSNESSVRSWVNSLFSSVCYRVGGWLIDPGDEWDGFDGVSAVLLTHAHFDHIYGLNALWRRSPSAKVYTNAVGREMLLDARKNLSYYHETPFVAENAAQIVVVSDGEAVELASCVSCGGLVRAVFTPGHHASCITWVMDGCLFTGDAYIPGLKTVTNLPGGNRQQAAESLRLIENLAIGRIVYPGHEIGAAKVDACGGW